MSARRYAVVWTEVAAQDVERLADYLSDEVPLRAEQIVNGRRSLDDILMERILNA